MRFFYRVTLGRAWVMERIEKEFGRLDILVNNAGWSTRVPHEKLWDLKDALRLCEIENRFDARFIQIVRETQALEDERTRVKQEIDNAIG